jgi:hypothetical protein
VVTFGGPVHLTRATDFSPPWQGAGLAPLPVDGEGRGGGVSISRGPRNVVISLREMVSVRSPLSPSSPTPGPILNPAPPSTAFSHRSHRHGPGNEAVPRSRP